MMCSECLQECDVRNVDIGIGSYEYWGSKSIDVHYVPLSTCCEADAYNEIIIDGDNVEMIGLVENEV